MLYTVPYLDLNEKRRREEKETGGRGPQILGWMYAGGGGGHSDAYCVQSKIRE